MMKVAIHAVDSHNYPNLALMRISTYHKNKGDTIEWFNPLFKYDKVYASKIFTFTPDDPYLPEETIRGGTGYDVRSKLPDEIERCQPDYGIYPNEHRAYGFLTRGCPNKCPWCVVPQKEGEIRPVATIEQIASLGIGFRERRECVLMDNNFLAAPFSFVSGQLIDIFHLGISVDFNQGLDARRVPQFADLLGRIKFIKRMMRMACDTDEMIEPCVKAIQAVRKNGFKGDILFYVLAKNDEIDSALLRIHEIVSADTRAVPFVMPYRSLTDNSILPNNELKRLARWCNRAWIRKSCSFDNYTC